VSVLLQFGGRRFVAGLLWEEPGTEPDRNTGRQQAWSAEWGAQTGWVPKEADLRGAEGVPSLAASLVEYLDSGGDDPSARGWVALLKADDDRVVMVQAQGGVIAADVVFDDGEFPLDHVETVRAQGAQVYGTPGAVTDGGRFAEIDMAALPQAAPETGLRRTGGGTSGLRVALASLVLLGVCVGGAAYMAPDMVFGLLGLREAETVEEAPVEEAIVAARIDSGALVEACARAHGALPPYMPAWRLISIECHGWFEEWELIGLRPELEGRAVMLVRWDLPNHYVAALHRRIAEEHLAGWYLASVVETSAWAVAPLGPVLVPAGGEPGPSYLAFRREVDRHLGMQGTRIHYAGTSGEVTVGLNHGLGRIAELVSAIPGFELVSLARRERGEWALEARPTSGFVVRESLFRELSTDDPAQHAAAF